MCKKTLLISLFFVLFSCGGHPAENLDGGNVFDILIKQDTNPDAELLEHNAVKLNGQYNTLYRVVENSCGKEPVADLHTKVDFVSEGGKKGILTFYEYMYWEKIDISLDKNGRFIRHVDQYPFFFYTGYYGFAIDLDGDFLGDTLKLKIVNTVYTGRFSDKMAKYCTLSYEVFGHKE